MKYLNQLDYPDMIYNTGVKIDYDYYLANKERIDASKGFSAIKWEPGMKAGFGGGPANIAQAGCGLCCAVMVADQLTPNSDFTLEDALQLSYDSGANYGAGTEYEPYAPAFAEKMGYTWEGTNCLDDVDKALHTGGAVVAKVGGDRTDGHIGFFTHGWHYILVLCKRADGKYGILDPSQTPTKYDEEGRKGIAEIDGKIIYVPGEILLEEVKLFDPGFYLFFRK